MRDIILGIAFAAMLPMPVSAQSFVGEWLATAHSPEGSFSETVNVHKVDDSYRIEVKLVQALPPGTPEAGHPTEISLDGDHFVFKRLVSDEFVITYSGVVSEDTFTGMVDIAGFQIPYTGVRALNESASPER